MDTLSYVFTNTLRGYIGGASSIIPIIILYVNFDFIQIYLSQQLKHTESKINTITSYTNLPIIISTVGAIIGGVLADNYTESSYNGITYGTIMSIISNTIMLYYNNT